MIESSFNWVQDAINWKALPKDLRKPRAVRDFCKLRGLPESTFYYEISKKENQVEILRKSLDNAKESAPEVLEKLVENAKSGREKSIEIFLKYVLGVENRYKHFEKDYTDERSEDNRRALREIAEVLSERRKLTV